MTDLLAYFQEQQDEMVSRLTELVNFESFSQDKPHVDVLADHMTAQFADMRADSVERIEQAEVGDCVLAKWNGNGGTPILILVHMDTVWPVGTLADRPVEIKDRRLYGPGAVDMKGGIVVAMTAIRGLVERGEVTNPIWILATSDEEIGSHYSEELIVETARSSGLVLVMEPPAPGGELKTARKGIAAYEIVVEGVASHAGNKPEEGVNAILEMSQQVMKISQLQDLRNGLSVAVTTVEGGVAGNVIPDHVCAHVDVRSFTALQMDQVHEELMDLRPHIPGAKVHATLKGRRDPMERDDTMNRTFAQAKRIGSEIGLTVREDSVGGASDGNLTSSAGVPTLDGMGSEGDGLHALHEHVLIRSLPKKAALVAAILRDWQFN